MLYLQLNVNFINMRTSGFKIFKIFEIDIHIDYSWLVIFGLVFWIFSINYYPALLPDKQPLIYLILGATTAVLFFSSALLHEIAHSLVSIKNNIKVNRITLFLFGGVAELFEEPKNPSSEFKIASAGPAISIFLGLLFYLLSIAFKEQLTASLLFSTLFQTNMLLAIFNLLPGFPLDGGRILRSILWGATKNIKLATKIASNIGRFIALTMVAFGIFQIIFSGFFSGFWMVFIGLFLYQAAAQSYMELLINEALKKETVENIIRKNTITVKPQLSINELLTEYFLKYKSESFPVIQNDEIIGLVTLKDLQKHNQNELANARVWDYMRRFPYNLFVKVDDQAVKALRLMLSSNINFIPVKDEEGKLKGLLTLEDIADYLNEKKVI